MSQYSTDASTVAVGSPGEGGGTTDQVKDQVREKAAVAQDKARGALGQSRPPQDRDVLDDLHQDERGHRQDGDPCGEDL